MEHDSQFGFGIESRENLVGAMRIYRTALEETKRRGFPVGADQNMKEAVREEIEFLGGSRITNKAAVRAFVRDYARAQAKSFYKMEYMVPALEKRLSECRSIIRKIREK